MLRNTHELLAAAADTLASHKRPRVYFHQLYLAVYDAAVPGRSVNEAHEAAEMALAQLRANLNLDRLDDRDHRGNRRSTTDALTRWLTHYMPSEIATGVRGAAVLLR
jgi:nitrogen-specific signal transduction histidine kinase